MLLKEKFNRNFKSYVFIFLTLHGDTFGLLFWFSRLLVLHLVSITSLTFKSIDTLLWLCNDYSWGPICAWKCIHTSWFYDIIKLNDFECSSTSGSECNSLKEFSLFPPWYFWIWFWILVPYYWNNELTLSLATVESAQNLLEHAPGPGMEG